jgi:hypothetical protein
LTDKALQTVEETHKQGRPPEITRQDAEDFLAAISDGLTQDQAAAVVGFNPKSLAKWVKAHPELSGRVSRARAECVRARIKQQTRIGNTEDVKGLNAAVKANACLLAAYDDRFRKQRDGDGANTGGTNITVITAVAPQSIAGFFAAGGKAQPQAVKILVEKYGEQILGEIDEETALKIAADSVDENGNGTQSKDRGGRDPGDSATHTPTHPRNKSDIIDVPITEGSLKTCAETAVEIPKSGILDSPVLGQEAPDGA